MEQKYFKYFQFLMKWAFGLKTRNKKEDLYLFDFDKVKVALLNDIPNKRVIVFYFKESVKDIHRVLYYGYHAPELRKSIVYTVANIIKDEDYFDNFLKNRKSFSYKRSARQKNYLNYIKNKNNG